MLKDDHQVAVEQRLNGNHKCSNGYGDGCHQGGCRCKVLFRILEDLKDQKNADCRDGGKYGETQADGQQEDTSGNHSNHKGFLCCLRCDHCEEKQKHRNQWKDDIGLGEENRDGWDCWPKAAQHPCDRWTEKTVCQKAKRDQSHRGEHECDERQQFKSRQFNRCKRSL